MLAQRKSCVLNPRVAEPDRKAGAHGIASHVKSRAASNERRYRTLDLWRGVACLMVIAFHATLEVHSQGTGVTNLLLTIAHWGWAGVPMFFVISGYCIAVSLANERSRGGDPRKFFLRRTLRIYPPYWVVLGICAVLVGLVDGYWQPGFFGAGDHPINRPQLLTMWQWVGALTLTETWRHHIIGGPMRHLLGHSWSLCYEIQFYALAALALWVAPRRPLRALGFVTLAVLVGRHVAESVLPRGALDGFFFDGTWLAFAAGILVYNQVSLDSRSASMMSRVALLIGIAWTLRHHEAVEVPLLTAFGFALLLSLLHRWDFRLAETPVLRPLMTCGKIGYSLYLVHWPLVKGIGHGLRLLGVTGPVGTLVLTLPLCLIVSVVVAAVYHHVLEQRCHLRMKNSA